jgi:hypothetical protein
LWQVKHICLFCKLTCEIETTIRAGWIVLLCRNVTNLAKTSG